MCKYKPSLTKIETFYIFALLNSANYRIVDFKYALCFYSYPAIGNSFPVTQKVHDFRYRQ